MNFEPEARLYYAYLHLTSKRTDERTVVAAAENFMLIEVVWFSSFFVDCGT